VKTGKGVESAKTGESTAQGGKGSGASDGMVGVVHNVTGTLQDPKPAVNGPSVGFEPKPLISHSLLYFGVKGRIP
jgi:hypothetical protein